MALRLLSKAVKQMMEKRGALKPGGRNEVHDVTIGCKLCIKKCITDVSYPTLLLLFQTKISLP